MNDLLMLAVLLNGPQHGYALKKTAGLLTGHADIHNNLVYPLLRRFGRQGWVTRKKAPGARGQTRQVYSLTALGRRTLLARLRDFNESAAGSGDQFRLRVGMFSLLDAASREAILEKREAFLRHSASHFDALVAAMEIGSYGREVVRFLRGQIDAELTWIAKLRRMDRNRNRKTARHKE